MTDAQIAGGHKANLNNPRTSDESKQHSKKVLDEDFNGGDGAYILSRFYTSRSNNSCSSPFHRLR